MNRGQSSHVRDSHRCGAASRGTASLKASRRKGDGPHWAEPQSRSGCVHICARHGAVSRGASSHSSGIGESGALSLVVNRSQSCHREVSRGEAFSGGALARGRGASSRTSSISVSGVAVFVPVGRGSADSRGSSGVAGVLVGSSYSWGRGALP